MMHKDCKGHTLTGRGKHWRIHLCQASLGTERTEVEGNKREALILRAMYSIFPLCSVMTDGKLMANSVKCAQQLVPSIYAFELDLEDQGGVLWNKTWESSITVCHASTAASANARNCRFQSYPGMVRTARSPFDMVGTPSSQPDQLCKYSVPTDHPYFCIP